MDAHQNEYLAAIAGMQETYGTPAAASPGTPDPFENIAPDDGSAMEAFCSPARARTYAIGDFVSGCSGGKRWSGRIWNVEGDRLSIEFDGGWLAVSAKDVTH
jgi:hypothetical protein